MRSDLISEVYSQCHYSFSMNVVVYFTLLWPCAFKVYEKCKLQTEKIERQYVEQFIQIILNWIFTNVLWGFRKKIDVIKPIVFNFSPGILRLLNKTECLLRSHFYSSVSFDVGNWNFNSTFSKNMGSNADHCKEERCERLQTLRLYIFRFGVTDVGNEFYSLMFLVQRYVQIGSI